MFFDYHQSVIHHRLQQLTRKLEHLSSSGFLQKFFSKKILLKSLYIHGDVGRGKTMLMKDFFHSLHETPKIYFHFNSFMRAIHEALRDLRKRKKKSKDELIKAVKKVIGWNYLVCFDEFQIVDIADAMLLSRIFSYLFSQGIVVVFTSNSHPKELYKNGLQRELFLEFVDKILLKNCEILHLNSPTDYRAQLRENLDQRYFTNRQEFEKVLESFCAGRKPKSTKLKVWGREIKIKKTFDLQVRDDEARSTKHEAQFIKKIALFTFNDLCQTEFSASDYQTICQNFDLIFLSKLPSLNKDDVNEVRRFMLFIDEVYENKTALIILAKIDLKKVFVIEGFERVVSRLNEIRSDKFWQKSKIGKR